MAKRQSSVRVVLELQLDGEPIRGWIEDADERRQAFWGWLELMQGLEAIAGNTARPPRTRRSILDESGRGEERCGKA